MEELASCGTRASTPRPVQPAADGGRQPAVAAVAGRRAAGVLQLGQRLLEGEADVDRRREGGGAGLLVLVVAVQVEVQRPRRAGPLLERAPADENEGHPGRPVQTLVGG